MRPLLIAVFALLVAFAAPLAAQQPQGEGDSRAALDSLLDVLRDDTARAALIAELERSLDPDAEPAPAVESPLVAMELRSLGGQIADFTQRIAEGAAAGLVQLWTQILAAPQIFTALSIADLRIIGAIALDLAALIAITYGGYFAMRAMTGKFRRRIKAAVEERSIVARFLVLGLTLLVDLAAAILPWAVGYIAALSLLGVPGDISFPHSLYLNAFVIIELAMAMVRLFISPHRAELRLIPLSDGHAGIVTRWARLFVSLFVYGQLLVLPLVSRTISPGAGRAIAVIGLLIMLSFAAAAVLRANLPLSRMLARGVRNTRNKQLFRFVVHYWHVPVLLYLAALAVMALTRPVGDFYAILLANGQIVLAVVVGLVAANMLDKMIGRGIQLPTGISARVPLLERRLNSFVPRMLWLLRLSVLAAIVIFCLHTLGVIDFFALLESQLGARLAGSTITVLVIVLATFLLWLVLNSWVDYRINPEFAVAVSARERTLLVLLRNALTIALAVISLMFVLSEIGINIAPLLASAGVIGLAIGFGAQKLVQDIITGIFIQLEGAIDVGDVVSIGGISGVVERLTIRSASLRDVEGSYHIIPFSSVDTVTNFMRGFSYALIDMGVGYRENAEEVKQAMFDAFAELRAHPDHKGVIIADFEWMGVNAFGASEVVFRGRIKTLPGKQWATRRAYYAIVKRIFDERDIEIPFPHQTVYFGVGKDGKAPPMHVVQDKSAAPAPQPPAASPAEPPAPARRRRKKASAEIDLPDPDAGPDRS